MEQTVLNNMALIRIISGLLEIATAIIFIKIGRVDSALRLNAFLGLIGPIVFIKLVLLSLGLLLVIVGTKT